MKIYQRLLVASASVVLASTASAGALNTFQFVDNGSAWTTYGVSSGATPGTGPYSSVGMSETFAGSNGLQVTATFREDVNKTTGAGGSAVKGYFGHGIGVKGSDGWRRRVDNDGEAIVLSFGSDVIWKSSFFWGYGNSSDVGVFYWDSGAWTNLLYENNFSGYQTTGLQDVVSSSLMLVNTDNGLINDKWVLKGFAVEEIENVPEPAMLSLMMLGLLGMARGQRRRTLKK